MLSLIVFIHIAQANSSQGSLDKDIFFNEETKILLAKKIINVQFLVPLQRFEMTLISSVDQIAQSLQNMWQTPTYFCYQLHKYKWSRFQNGLAPQRNKKRKILLHELTC